MAKHIKLFEEYIEGKPDYKLKYDEDTEEIEQWMRGECIPFAVALYDIFVPRYELEVFLDSTGDEYDDPEFIHAYCRSLKYPDLIIDAVGVRPISQLYNYFHDVWSPYTLEVATPDELIERFAGNDDYNTLDYLESDYEEAKKWILKNKDYYEV